MKNSFKICLVILSLGCAVVFGKRFYSSQFAIEKIQFDWPQEKTWEMFPLSPNERAFIQQLFSQPFSYLGKGARTFSFVSQDGKYVLKFFKYRYHLPHWAVRWLPPIFPCHSYRQRKMQKTPLYQVLNGYKVAYDHDPLGTGLLTIHLNLTKGEYPSLIVKDKQGKAHQVSLDETRFILQKKVVELIPLLDECLKKGEARLATHRLCQVLDLYLFYYQQGLNDLGVGILKNNGFLGDRPIHFDVSKMIVDEKMKDPLCQKEQFKKIIGKVEEWLEKNHPQYRQEIIPGLEERYL